MTGVYCCMGCEQMRPINKAESDRCGECREYGDTSARPTFRMLPGAYEHGVGTMPRRRRILSATVHLPAACMNANAAAWLQALATYLVDGGVITVVVSQ